MVIIVGLKMFQNKEGLVKKGSRKYREGEVVTLKETMILLVWQFYYILIVLAEQQQQK